MSEQVLTPEERAAAKARCDAATIGDGSIGAPGWTVGVAGRANVVRADDHNIIAVAQVFRDEDARFVAEARSDLPRALATIEALTVERDAWRRYANALKADHEDAIRGLTPDPELRYELAQAEAALGIHNEGVSPF